MSARPAVAPRRPVAVVGPTASGKSAVAMELASLLGDAEIVSVDSMQVYRGMDIGTASPSAADRARVAHHMVDVLDPSEECSVAWFQQESARVVAGLVERHRRPLFVGGTGLYHRAVVDGLSIPPEFPAARARLLAELDDGLDPAALHARLAAVDPVAASRIEPTNARRLVRALEVVEGSGRPFSSYGPGLTEYPDTGVLIVGLGVDRDELGPRVERRVDEMMAAGFLDEVRALADRKPPISRTAAEALGYRELMHHLRGDATLSDAVRTTVVRTRRFAVRQERWFRRDPRIEWFVAPTGAAETRAVAARIADTLEAR